MHSENIEIHKIEIEPNIHWTTNSQILIKFKLPKLLHRKKRKKEENIVKVKKLQCFKLP